VSRGIRFFGSFRGRGRAGSPRCVGVPRRPLGRAAMATGAGLLTFGTDERQFASGTRWAFADARSVGWTQRGLLGWKGHLQSGHVSEDPHTRRGGPFRVLQLGRTPPDEGNRLLEDSVMVMDNLLTLQECATMIGAANAWCDREPWTGESLRRMQCHTRGINLDGEAHALAHIILTRVLWFVENLEPELTAELFPRKGKRHLPDMSFTFSGQEPMINRYTTGGMFDPHQDGHALTVLVPLSAPDMDFSAGGTAFWSGEVTSDSSVAKSFPPSLVIRPPAGTGIFWRGHITHAGLPIRSGMRHVFVASFDLS